nr:TadE/TadG family type IV pilus assembly protein [Serinibacter arcticus]
MAETVLVGALVLVLVLGLVQLAYALWVRTVLIDAAGEGARYAALLDGDLGSGEQRALQVAASGVTDGYVDHVDASVTSEAGYDVIVVELRAPVPVIGLLGPTGTLSVAGRAVVEQ